MSKLITRRSVMAAGAAGAVGTLTTLPISMVRLAFGGTRDDFTFTYISDAHIQQIKGASFVRNWDMGLKRAVAEANLVQPESDFVMFGGDLAQLGKKDELDHGAEILSHLSPKLHCVMGEHDYYLDLGEYWSKLYGAQYYSFDHKGVHFVVLNSILTTDEWTFHRWPSAEQRMQEMAGLDNPNGSPFMVGEKQRALAQGRPGENLPRDADRRVLAFAAAKNIQGLEFLDRRRRRGAGVAAAVQIRQCDLRPRSSDPI